MLVGLSSRISLCADHHAGDPRCAKSCSHTKPPRLCRQHRPAAASQRPEHTRTRRTESYTPQVGGSSFLTVRPARRLPSGERCQTSREKNLTLETGAGGPRESQGPGCSSGSRCGWPPTPSRCWASPSTSSPRSCSSPTAPRPPRRHHTGHTFYVH